MDVVEASHFEVIKKYLSVNRGYEFKMRRHGGLWIAGITDPFTEAEDIIVEHTIFLRAIEELSRELMRRS